MDIPDYLVDPTTIIARHSVWAHYVCVLLRCSLAMYLWTKYDTKRDRPTFALLCVAVLLLFAYKYFKVHSWKVFARAVFVYAAVLAVLYLVKDRERAKTIAGTLVFMDPMMGLQSRFTATLLQPRNVDYI